jgi:signal transduction histidine kinase
MPLSVPRPTKVESAIAALLLAESVMELVEWEPTPQPAAVRVLVALVVPVAVAFSRRFPLGTFAALLAMWLLDTVAGPPQGTMGTGFGMIVIAFSLSAWYARPWAYLAALLALDTVRMSRMTDGQPEDVYIDWAFIALVVLVGRFVRHRTTHAEELGSRLQLSEQARETAAADAVARERAQLARELHDIVAHAVSVMVVQAGTARPRAERVDAELADVLATVERSGREALNELRRLLGVLRTEDAEGFAPLPDVDRLPELIERVRTAGLDARLRIDLATPLPAAIGLCAYRAVQEGLTNALRHAAGGVVDVSLVGDGRRLTVVVADQGGGEGVTDLGSGNGLTGLRERVLLSGGTLSAGPSGDGFTLRVELPLDTSPALVLM